MALNPASLSFGSVSVGSSATAQVTLSNNGTGTLSITSLAIAGTNANDFAQTNTCGGSLAAGTACGVSVTFTPSASGNSTASISVADNASGSPQTVRLSGTGSASHTVNVNPGDDLQSLVDQNSASTTFQMAAGVYRLQSVVPKNNDSFIGQAGTVLSGADLLTSFSQSGSNWVSLVQVTQLPSYVGHCDSAHPASYSQKICSSTTAPRHAWQASPR